MTMTADQYVVFFAIGIWSSRQHNWCCAVVQTAQSPGAGLSVFDAVSIAVLAAQTRPVVALKASLLICTARIYLPELLSTT